MLIICIFAAILTLCIMKKELLTNFDLFRKWFNKTFSLSLNGKFVGLSRLSNWQLFAYRLYKILNGYYRKPFSDVISINLRNESIKLYNR